MKCLRCGYCCKNLFVVVVDDPKKGLTKNNFICYIGDGNNKCKHLKGNKPGEYSCAIHNELWYKNTPCFDYTQIENSENDDCRIGKHIMKRQKS